jgi:hypothetical protein
MRRDLVYRHDDICLLWECRKAGNLRAVYSYDVSGRGISTMVESFFPASFLYLAVQ